MLKASDHGMGVGKYRDLLISLFLAVAVLLVYWQVQYFDLVDYDDVSYILHNRHVKAGVTWEGVVWALGDIHTGYWHPLTWFTHMLDSQLFRSHYGGHHWTNVILHIINTILLFYMLKQMTGESWKCAFVALLFAIHPLNVESVAWVAERKNVLSTFFLFAGLWLYSLYVGSGKCVWYVSVILCFSLGLMAKPILVTFPFLLVLLDYWPLRRLSYWRDFSVCIREKIPLFLLSAAICVGTYLAGKHGGAVVSYDALPLSCRINNALLSYVKYLEKMFWPENLAVFYPYEMSLPVSTVAGAAVTVCAITVSSLFLVSRCPYVPVGWFWYLGTLVPVIGLVQAGEQAMADRYAYISLPGIFLIFAWGIPDLVKRWKWRKVLYSLLIPVIVLPLMIRASNQVRVWENSITLFTHALNVTEKNYLAHNNLGVALLREGKTAEALEHFNLAVRIKPYYSEAHTNIGMVLTAQGKLDEALLHLGRALEGNPRNEKAHNNLGVVYARQGKYDRAIAHFTEALQKNPDYADALHNMGSVLASQGKFQEAVQLYVRAIKNDPESAMTHCHAGLAYLGLGEHNKAIEHFDEALRITPHCREAFYGKRAAVKMASSPSGNAN